jgi:hypothetical protein
VENGKILEAKGEGSYALIPNVRAFLCEKVSWLNDTGIEM